MKPHRKIRALRIFLAIFMLPILWQASFAGPLRDRVLERRTLHAQSEAIGNDAASRESISLPANIRVVRDTPYGSDAQQRFDVYIPMQASHAPVIFMVHGGAWSLGDKAAQSVVENKVARWVPRGFIVISTNYRLLPKAAPIEQARDVARSLAVAQEMAASWGGDRNRFILMGHSAGAHLVALLATSPSISSGIVSTPWLGTVALDSAALDVVEIMEARHARFYDRAFGQDREVWKASSPFHTMTGSGQPMLLVCSTQRQDSCPQARRFVAKASSLGRRASLLEQNLSHREINQRLGEAGSYTEAVESFLDSLAKPEQFTPGRTPGS